MAVPATTGHEFIHEFVTSLECATIPNRCPHTSNDKSRPPNRGSPIGEALYSMTYPRRGRGARAWKGVGEHGYSTRYPVVQLLHKQQTT